MNDSALWQIRHFVYQHFADTTKPPSVEYRLTELGESLLTPLTELIAWAEKSQARITTSRTAFDAADPSRG